jgi:hypothetical protein
MSYVIAIPTYKRSKLLQEKTLKTLKDGGVDTRKIHIFVADKEEAEVYRSMIPRDNYNKIIIGKRGITPQRKYIVKYFPEGTHIVSIDDDIAGLYKKNNDKLTKVTNINEFIKNAFQECKKENLYIWGVYPVYNAFFMKTGISYNLKFLVGAFYGFINRYDRDIIPTLGEKEDYEISILYYLKDGGVVRYNDICIKTKYQNPNGGLGATKERLEVNEKAAKDLYKRYPEFGSIWHRKNGMAEFRLSRHPRRDIKYAKFKKTIIKNQ